MDWKWRLVGVRWVSRDSHCVSLATRTRYGVGASAAQLGIGVLIVLASSLLSVSSIGAQTCHETVRRDPVTAPVVHAMVASAHQQSRHNVHMPAVQQEPRHQMHLSVVNGEQVVSSRHSCCDQDGLGFPCPSSCPAGASCSSHGPVTALLTDARTAVSTPVNASGLGLVGERPDSWAGALDTPPPKN